MIQVFQNQQVIDLFLLTGYWHALKLLAYLYIRFSILLHLEPAHWNRF